MEMKKLAIAVSDDPCRQHALAAINKLAEGMGKVGYRVEIDEVIAKYVVDRLLLTTVSFNIFDVSGNLTRYKFSLNQMMLKNGTNKVDDSYGYYDTNGCCWGTYDDIINFLRDGKEGKNDGK